MPAHPRHREVTHREVELAADAVAGGGLCLHAIFNYLAVSRSLQEFFCLFKKKACSKKQFQL